MLHIAADCVEPDVEKRLNMNEAASRIEVVVADMQRSGSNGSNGEPAANSHAAYVREGAGDRSARRKGSVGEMSGRRSDDTQLFSIS
jgi:hypothetical protein